MEVGIGWEWPDAAVQDEAAGEGASSRPFSRFWDLTVDGLSSKQWRREPQSQSGGKSGYH